MFIDTHCHLDAAEFDADRGDVYQNAVAAGVDAIVVPAIQLTNLPVVLATCNRYEACLPALGFHPVFIHAHRPDHLGTLREAIEIHRPVAVGEIGLDLFVRGLDFDTQLFYYVEQLKIARDFDLPVVLHVRRANDQILKQLRRFRPKGGIAHAFNGSRQQADEFIKLGFKLGFGGAMTYPRANNLRRLATELPLEAIVLETDAPDIPPIHAPRQRNSPAHLPHIAASMAELRGVGVSELASATSRNAREVLGLSALH